MNSATTTNTPNSLTSLGFEKLGEGISFYQHTKEVSENKEEPTLIILCSWAFAQPKHIAKYVQPYQELFESADILLIQNVIANAIWRPDEWQLSFFQPAALKVKKYVAQNKSHRILLQVFSNGGSHAAVQLSEACRKLYGLKLPVDALLLDSAPAQPRFGPTIKAMVQGIPSQNPLVRVISTSLSYLSVGATALVDILGISEPAAWKLYRLFNAPDDSFLLKSAGDATSARKPIPRTYLYSWADEMVLGEDVLGHARIAREKLAAAGFSQDDISHAIKLEEFVGTPHVNHIKNESKRYWTIVEETWKRTLT